MSSAKEKLTVKQMTERAQQCFPGEGGKLRVNHDGAEHTFGDASEFFSKEHFQFQRAMIEDLIDENGTWKYRYQGDLTFEDLTPRELNRVLKQTLYPVYEVANASLDTTSPQGFNRHDQAHIDAVIQGAIAVLKPVLRNLLREGRTSPAKKEEYKKMLHELFYVGRGHDIGNILSRQLHSLLSPDMFEEIFPGQLNGNRSVVRRGMILHNEPVAKSAMESVNVRSYAEQMQYMSKKMTPVGLAVIVGDKFDVGLHRITKLEHVPDETNQDKHLLLNMDFQNRGLEFSPDEKGLTWNLDYCADMSAEAQEKFRHLLREKKNGQEVVLRPWRSQTTEELHKKYNIPYTDSSRALLIKLYWSRIRYAILAAFALHPELETFSIAVSDRSADGHPLESSSINVRRSQIDEDFARIEKRFALKKPEPAPEVAVADQHVPETIQNPREEVATKEVQRIEVSGPLAMVLHSPVR